MANKHEVRLNTIKQEDKSKYIEYLLLADDSEVAVNNYINDGDMFSVSYGNEIAGVALFTFHPNRIVELKNIALSPKYRGKGLGKFIINKSVELYRKREFNKMIVGTANSSIGNLAFYQKAGFRMSEIKKDFFKDYPSPIIEEGIRALDMVMFEKSL